MAALEQQQQQHAAQQEAADTAAAAAAAPGETLWSCCVVVGLANAALQTVQGDQGFLGTDHRYKPAFVDSLPYCSFDEGCRLPPQLPLCCIPAGIDFVLLQNLDKADLTPHSYACVLTEGDGAKLYASCLSFYDRVPSELCARHEDLLGAVALKAVCLLSRRPYLTTSQQVLQELYSCALQRGSSIPVPDIIHSLLAVQCPTQGGPKLCLKLCTTQRLVCPPLPIGPPPGEVSLQPLLEVMQPDSLVGLFAAVLLEQRVLLRSQHHWLLTVAAEGVVRLLYPLKYQHVNIPVMPWSLTDYLEAPTPFLMGLHSDAPVDPRLLDTLVVADLDRGTLQLGRDDGLMRRCLSHPYMQRLHRRVRMLMQPAAAEAGLVRSSTVPEDPWVLAIKALGPAAGWSPSKQALLLRVFMEFFHDVLRDYHLYLSTAEASERASLVRRDSRIASAGGSSSGGSSGGGVSSGGSSSSLTSARTLRNSLSRSSGPGGLSGLAGGRSSSLAPGSGALLQAQNLVGMQALLDYHTSLCRHSDPALLQQVLQGLPFLCFCGENTSVRQDPRGWLKDGEASLKAWRAAEEELHILSQSPSAAGPAQTGATNSNSPTGAQAAHTQPDAASSCSVVCIPQQQPSALVPPGGLVHSTFPALVLTEYSERSQGQKRRKTGVGRQKRASAGVGRRRAISELMGSPLDLRRKAPQPAGTNTDPAPTRLGLLNTVDTTPVSPSTLTQLGQGPLTPLGLPSLSKISNVSNSSSSTNATLSEGYSAEAELIGRQIGMLVHLMQAASTAAAAAAAVAAVGASSGRGAAAPAAAGVNSADAEPSTSPSSSSNSSSREAGSSWGGEGRRLLRNKSSLGGASAATVLRTYSSAGGARSSKAQLTADVLEAARQLLCVQTGGNGWFLVSRLKELVANPPAPLSSDADRGSSSAAAAGSSNARGGASTTAGAAGAVPGGKKGAEAAGGNGKGAQQGKGKSGKLGGVHLSGGSSSSSKSSGLAALKVSHGVESFANAASAMASVITRNASATKQRFASGASNSSSPTHTVDTSKASSAPNSSCGGKGPGPSGNSSSGPAFQHSKSCKLEYREHHARPTTSSEGGIPPAPPPPGSSSIVLSPQAQAAPDAAAAAVAGSSLGGALRAGSSAGPAAQACSSSDSSSSSADKQPQAQQQAQDAAAAAGAGNGQSPMERQVPSEVFDVLGEMLNAVVEVAAAQDDPRVVLAVLELASLITRSAGGCKQYLLAKLSSNPALRTEQLWATTFAFAVSSSYLSAEEFVDVRATVIRCVRDFAVYMAGAGIPDAAAWVLLTQMAAEHLQLAHAEPLDAATLLELRRQLAQAPQRPVAAVAADACSIGRGQSSSSSSSSSAQVGAVAGQESSSSSSSSRCEQPDSRQQQQQTLADKQQAAVLQQVVAGLQVCGISVPLLQLSSSSKAGGSSSSSSSSTGREATDSWQASDPAARSPTGPYAAAAAGSYGVPITLTAPDAAELQQQQQQQPATMSSPRPMNASGIAGIAACDTESPVLSRPLSPLNPASIAAAAAADRGMSGSGATTPRGTSSNLPTPFRLSPRAAAAAANSSGGAGLSPRGIPAKAKEGHGSYAKLLSRQATSSLSTSPSTAALGPGGASSSCTPGGSPDRAADAGGNEGAGPSAGLAVQGGCLADPGALQWAPVHNGRVLAMAASGHTAVSVGADGYMRVLDLQGGTMRLAASMQIPYLQDNSGSACSSTAAPAAAADAVRPVVQLWPDGRRAAVGNARHQAVWVLDLAGGRPGIELSGLGSPVSCLLPLHRNRDALLSGLSHSSSSTSSSSSNAAVAYLWDLRNPKRPVCSWDAPVAAAFATAVVGTPATVTPALPEAAAAGGVQPAGAGAGVRSGGSAAVAGAPGILCLAVHDSGALAAAGLRDGRVLIWDMRQPAAPLAECRGHSGPVKHISFLPSSASAAAGLGRTPLLLTASNDWTARLWDASSGASLGTCIGHGGAETALQVVHSSGSTRLVTGAADGSVGVWGLGCEMLSLVQQHEAPVMLLKQGADTLVAGAADKTCHVWGLQGLMSAGSSSGSGSSGGATACSTATQLLSPQLLASQERRAAVGAMAFDPMAEMLCAGHTDGIVSVWNCCHSAAAQGCDLAGGD